MPSESAHDRRGARGGAGSPPDRLEAAWTLREEASREGFVRFGVARAGVPHGDSVFREWLAAGRHAGMRYLARTAKVRADARELLPGARSVVCLAAPHASGAPVATDGSRIARYACGPDYHGTLRARAERVARRAASRLAGPWRWRVCVDSTPLAERSFAAAAGLGWIGKNGCLIDAEHGSFLLLAEIVTDLDLPCDEPVAELCGTCTRCLDACPTGAFLSPGLLDSSRCLAYWTIEHRGPIPDAVKETLGPHVFGCDVCQDVCPWNAPLSPPAVEAPPARGQWIAMGPGEWRRRFGATALNRAGRRGLARNAAASAGSTGEKALLPVLRSAAGVAERGLADAARWAAHRLETSGPSIERRSP
jgi:epoxyqueuosine reductase